MNTPCHDSQGLSNCKKPTILPKRKLPLQSIENTPCQKKLNRETRSTVTPKDVKYCLLCQSTKYVRSPTGSRVVESLTVCQELSATKKLLEAAETKQDEELLRSIRGYDLVAMGVRYHRSCYRYYTNLKAFDRLRGPQVKNQNTFYDDAYEEITSYVKKAVFDEARVVFMSDLLSMFNQKLQDLGVKQPSYRSEKLKKRLLKQYGDALSFWQPRDLTKSEVIYDSAIPTGQIVESGLQSAEPTPSPEDKLSKKPNLESESATLHHAAKFIRRTLLDVKSTVSSPPKPGDFEEDKVPIPDSIYNFLACVLHGEAVYQPSPRINLPISAHRQVLSIGQDLTHAISRGRVKMQKHVAVPMIVRNLSGTADLITMLNRMGHSLSYTQAEEMETAVAEDEENERSLPSSSLRKSFATFCWDNNDLQEETLSGRGTTHCTNGIVVQRTPQPPGDNELDSEDGSCSNARQRTTLPPNDEPDSDDHSHTNQEPGRDPNHHARRRRSLPETPTKIFSYPVSPRKDPELLSVNYRLLERAPSINQFHVKDLGWFLARLPTDLTLFDEPDEQRQQSVPGWTAFNVLVQKDRVPQQSNISYCQPIDASPTDMDTVYTILKNSLAMADELNQHDCPVVCDLAIYAKIMQVIWANRLEFSRIVPRLGTFHIIASFLSVIGKRYGEAGLDAMLVESGVLAHGSLAGVSEVRHYNRAIRMHKIVYEALERLRWVEFGKWLEEECPEDAVYSDILMCLHRLHLEVNEENFDALLELQEFQHLQEAYTRFCESYNGPMKAFWGSYLEMVSLLLQLIRATREGNWLLHLSCIEKIIPYMFAYDNINYARYLPVYLAQMTNLPRTNPQAHHHFLSGSFGVQRSRKHGFSQLPVDQTIEQTVNRSSKARGGIVGFSLKKGAVQRWMRASHVRAEILDRSKKMFGMDSSKGVSHKECNKPRMRRDESDVLKVMEVVQNWCSPFIHSDSLISLASGKRADETTCDDLCLAQKKGKNAMENFLEKHMSQGGNFFAPIRKLQLKTFKEKKTSSEDYRQRCNPKRPSTLFARMLVVAQRRQMDLRKVLQYELGPVPWSLATPGEGLVKTPKSALVPALEKDHATTDLTTRCTACVIDAMALLQSMSLTGGTFAELACKIMDAVLGCAGPAERIDVVADQYPTKSIKGKPVLCDPR